MITNKILRELIIGKYHAHAFGGGNDFVKEEAKKSVKFADELMEFMESEGILNKVVVDKGCSLGKSEALNK